MSYTGQQYNFEANSSSQGYDNSQDLPPPPPMEEQKGAGQDWENHQEIGYQRPPPEMTTDLDDPFGVPPPPESLLNSLVFDEPDSPNNIMKDPNNTLVIKAGSFAKIIETLTHPSIHDSNFLYNFVLTYRSFATPVEVLEALIRRYDTAQESVKKAVGLRVFNVLKHWIEKAWHDFDKDAALPERCIDFLDRCIASNDPLKQVASGIRTNLVRKKSGDEASVTKTHASPPPLAIGPRDNASTPLLDLSSEEIARQLTLIEWDIWVKIQPWECLGLSWTKKHKEESAPNVLALINRFNAVSGWVATTICTLESVKKRTKAIGKFLEIAGHLLQMGNLNAVMEVISGLNRGPVYRLKQSWDGLTSQQRKTFDEVKKLTDRSLSYANLRGSLRKLNPPCIPYLGMYLTDLTFIEEGNKDFLNGLINWNKRHLISETIRAIKQYQLQAYIFTPVEWIKEKLCTAVVLSEDELYELSEWLEVRPGKERGPKPAALVIAQQAAPVVGTVSGTLARGSGNMVPSPSRAKVDLPTERVDLEHGHNWPFYENDSPYNVDIDPSTNLVKSGTLNKIIERLTHNSTPDSNSLFGFLACFRSFSTPIEVMDLLTLRYQVPPPKDKNNQEYVGSVQRPIQLRVFNVIKTWVDRHYGDFDSSPELKSKLKAFISGPLSNNEGFAKVLNALLAKQEAAYNQPVSTEGAPAPFVPHAHLSALALTDINSEEFARQLSLVHHKTFTSIRPEELLDKNYRGSDKETKAKNVVSLQNHYHSLATFVTSELTAAEQQQHSGVIANKFLEIASRLVTHHNYFATRAIIESIDNYYKTHSHILDNITVDSRNVFNEQKEQLITKASSKFNLSPPMVVPLQAFFTEIAAAEDNIGPPLSDKRINLAPRLVASEPLVRLLSMQKNHYIFHEVPAIQQYLISHKVVAVHGGPAQYRDSVAGSGSIGWTRPSGSSGSVSGLTGGSTLSFFIMDLVLHDDEIKKEIQDMSRDMYNKNLALIQAEIKNLLNNQTPQKLALQVSPPTAQMPSVMTPSLIPPSLVGSAPAPGSFSLGAISNVALNPALTNPALSNPALLNPALATIPTANINPALVNPAIMNPALATTPSFNAALSPAPVNPVNVNQTPATNPALVNPALSSSLAPSHSSSMVNSPSPASLSDSASIPVRPVPGSFTAPLSVGKSPLKFSNPMPAFVPPALPPLPSSLPPPPATLPQLPIATEASTAPSAPLPVTPSRSNESLNASNSPYHPTHSTSATAPIPIRPNGLIDTPPVRSPSDFVVPSNSQVGIQTHSSGEIPLSESPKKLPLPAPAKARGSFTSASKQASIKELMAGLGKMSPSASNPALRGSNPLSNSGSVAIVSPTASPSHSRSNSNSSLLVAENAPSSTSPSPTPVSVQPPTTPVPEPSVSSIPIPDSVPQDLKAAAQTVLAKDFGGNVESWSAVEPGTNATLTTDLLKTERANYVCSIQPTIAVADVHYLVRVGKLFKQTNPSLPLACIIMTYNIEQAAAELASRFKMKVYKL